MKKVLIGDTLYNQAYLIQFNETKGATINISKLAFDDEQFKRAFADSEGSKKVFIGDDMIALTCIGTAYATVINEDVIELAKENAIEWYNKQIGFAIEALVTHTLNIKKVKKVSFKKLQFND
jgi:hypothetical protein